MIRDDVVFHGKGHDVDIGPGQYTLPNTFCKNQGKRMGRGPILTRPKQAHIAVEQEDPKEILVFIYMYVFMYNKLFYNSC